MKTASTAAPPVPVGIVNDLTGVALGPDEDWANLGRYRGANAALRGAPQRLVFLGDSITEMWADADPALFAPGIVNRGIGGQTSPQMLLRFMADVVRLQPRAVHLMAGTNDIAGNTGPITIADYQNNILAMIALARTHGLRVIIASIPPMRTVPWRSEVENPAARVIELNRWLSTLAGEQRLIYADYHAVLAAPDGGLHAAFTSDGVHLTDAGYAALRPAVGAAIAMALR
jgi:lysophospholipase L1-like esterase